MSSDGTSVLENNLFNFKLSGLSFQFVVKEAFTS
jgi:hypothetical protein